VKEFLADVDAKRRERLKVRFLEAYREKGAVGSAARSVGLHRSTIYRWMDADSDFAQAVADSFEDCCDAMEVSVYERGFKDSILAMFWLKAHRPKFKDKLAIDIEAVDREITEYLALLGPRAQSIGPPFAPEPATEPKLLQAPQADEDATDNE
jgi:hypothetical protein